MFYHSRELIYSSLIACLDRGGIVGDKVEGGKVIACLDGWGVEVNRVKGGKVS